MTYQIVFYNRTTGNISRKHNYKRQLDAVADLRKNEFTENAGIWAADNWLAKIREDTENENVQGV